MNLPPEFMNISRIWAAVSLGFAAAMGPCLAGATYTGPGAPPPIAPSSPASSPDLGDIDTGEDSGPVLLRFKYTQGESITYHYSWLTSRTSTIPDDDATRTGSLDFDQTDRVHAIRRSDGAANFVDTISNFHAEENGVSLTPGKYFHHEAVWNSGEYVDSRGWMSGGSKLSDSQSADDALDGLSLLGALSFITLPEYPVRVGDTWSWHSGNSRKGGLAMDAHDSVIGIWQDNGRTFVAIHSDITATVSYMMTLNQVNAYLSGPMSGSADIVIDNTRGMVREIKGQLSGNVGLNVVTPADPYGDSSEAVPLGVDSLSMSATQEYVNSTAP